jgi:lysophospholipase L1-like esterase
MDRRTVLFLGAASFLLNACGGGGGGSGIDATPAPVGAAGSSPQQPATPAATGLSPNIVAWGDSMTPAFALNLQVLYPDRVVVQEGFLGQTSTVIDQNEVADAGHRNWINVFWYGHNDVWEDPTGAAATIEANIANSIAHLAAGNTHFVVLGIVNRADLAYKGAPLYATIADINAALAARYPDNYLDVRSWLVNHYDPSNPQDVADDANDVPPSSLRYDEIHLRNEGSVLVAQRVKEFIDAKGW